MILAACPACERLYDVRHLAPESRVRCACDAVFAVPVRAPARVLARTCTSCGGTVGPEDEGCTYCGAGLDAIDRRESVTCPRCLGRMAEDARHCPGCGLEIAPQALAPVPDGRGCPRCGAGLRSRSLGVTDVVECGTCEGMWLSPAAFERVRRAAEQSADSLGLAGAEGAPVEAVGGSRTPGADVRYLPCLSCGELMFRRQYRYGGGSSGVVVDLCREHGIWLDRTELERIRAHVAARRAQSARSALRAREGGDWSGIDAPPPAAPRAAPLPGLEREAARHAGVVELALELLARFLG